MPYRLLALDLDGTLLDRRKEISPANLEAIREAQQAGLRVIVATARLPHTAQPFAQRIGAAVPMIACVGAWNIMPLRPDEVGAGAPARRAQGPDGSDDLTLFDPETVRRFADCADEEGLNLSITAAEPASTNTQASGAGLNARIILRWADHEEPHDLPAVVTPFVEFVPRLKGRLPQQVVRIFSGETRSAHRLFQVFRDQLGERVRFYRTSVDGVVRELHVVPGGVSKGRALEGICAQLGIAAAEVAAVGDSETDLDMIRWAGLGVAVADAMPEVQAAADLLAPASHADAVAWTIARLLQRPRAPDTDSPTGAMGIW